MSKISIENAVVTATADGVEYHHDFVTNITINDPRENVLTTSPQGGGNGLNYRTNISAPISLEMTVRNLPVELTDLYKIAFDKLTRLDFMILDGLTGERYSINRAILRTNPMNTQIAEGEASLDVMISASAPNAYFTHTGATE